MVINLTFAKIKTVTKVFLSVSTITKTINFVEQINGDLISKQLVLHKFTTKTDKKTNNI